MQESGELMEVLILRSEAVAPELMSAESATSKQDWRGR